MKNKLGKKERKIEAYEILWICCICLLLFGIPGSIAIWVAKISWPIFIWVIMSLIALVVALILWLIGMFINSRSILCNSMELIKIEIQWMTNHYELIKKYNDEFKKEYGDRYCLSKFEELLMNEFEPATIGVMNLAIEKKKYKLLKDLVYEKAVEGHAYAIYWRGMLMYSRKREMELFSQASKKGWLPAMEDLGLRYFERKDFYQAANCFSECIEMEEPCWYGAYTKAKLYLADLYFCGLGVEQDVSKADEMYRQIVDDDEFYAKEATLRLKRTLIPCPKCGCESKSLTNGEYKCDKCHTTFELASYDMTANSSEKSMSASEIYQNCADGFMTVHCFNNAQSVGSEGSGFLISRDGYAITNAHVVIDDKGKPYKYISVRFLDSQVCVKVLAYKLTQDEDLAILQLKYVPDGAKILTFANSNLVKSGDNVYAIGYPHGLCISIVNGIVSNAATRGNGTKNNCLLTNCSGINHGNSGGPLLNEYGQVIGVITWSAKNSEGLHFALSSNAVIEIIKEIGQDLNLPNIFTEI